MKVRFVMKVKSVLLVLLVLIVTSCGQLGIRQELIAKVEGDLNFAVSEITDKTALADSIYYEIMKYSRVGGTLITYMAVVDFHYLDPENFPVFQRIVYRYNETLREWERHRRFLLRLTRKEDDLEKYITGF